MGFVSVMDTRLVLDGAPYSFLGLNFWQAAWIALSDIGRLRRELDAIKRAGATVVRITATSEGPNDAPLQAVPTLQPRPGEFDETFARALDALMVELRARGMRAIMVMNQGLTQCRTAHGIPLPSPH